LPRRNSALKQKIDEETAFIKKLFQEGNGKQADQRLDEYMLAKSMEKLSPLIKEREELYEIIRREMGFDAYDLQRLAELEKMRDRLITLESREERLEFLERYDEYRLEIFKETLDSRKEIDFALSRLETIDKDKHDKGNLFNLRDYLDNVKNVRIMSAVADADKKRTPEERRITAVNVRGK
jgi:hypothetical protein